MPHQAGHGGFFGGLGDFIGGGLNVLEQQGERDQIAGLGQFQDQTFGGFGGSGFVGAGGQNQFQFDQSLGGLRGLLGGQGQQFLGGGIFNNPDLQGALGGANISGANQQFQQAAGQQVGSSAFGNLGNLAGTATGLAGQFAGQTAQGPQDFSGGLQANLFGQGAANQQAAGNQQALFNQSLSNQRAAFEPQANRQFNRLQDRLFATGNLGSTGGGEQLRGLFEAQNQADLGFQNNAFQQAQQQQQFLGNLGGQQIQQGAGLLGQNLGQFNAQAGLANQFLGQAGALGGQQFGQNIQSAGFNTSQGLQRLNAAQGLLGFGAGIQGQQFGLGLQANQGLLDQSNFGLNTILGVRGAGNDQIQAGGQVARALAEQGAGGEGSGAGDFLGGIVGGLGSIFSDARLKDNINRIGTLGDLGWYEWDWNSTAAAVGASLQPNYGVIAQEVAEVKPSAVSMYRGYLKVNYKDLY